MSTVALKPRPEVDEVDFSCRLPLLVLFISAAIWLVIAGLFGFISSLQFHAPNLLANIAWLTYGRIWPAYQNALLYGFCIPAGLGVGVWILARLGRTPLVQPWMVVLGAACWNLGVTWGVIGILAGDGTGFESLELPGYAAPFIFLGYLIIGLFAMLTFHHRVQRLLSAPQWFLFTAIFWFFWIYSTAELLLVTFSVRGVTQAIISWWFTNNLEVVFLGLTGMATAFYFLPRLTNRDSDNYYLEVFIYWMFILFASWGGIPGSAPVPAWMPSLSTVATVMTLIPLLALGIIVRQFASSRSTAATSGTGEITTSVSFVRFGMIAFLGAGLMRIINALPDVGPITDYTWFTAAARQLQTNGFFSMVMFGALYCIVPKLTGTAISSPKLIRIHFWLAALGILFTVIPLAVGGVLQGLRLRDPGIAFLDIFKSTLLFLRISTLGDLLITLGNLVFLFNLLRLVNEFYKARAELAYAAVTADVFKPAGAKS